MTATARKTREWDASADHDEILIGISSCILGEKVRFDGGHKRDDFLAETLAKFVRFVPVCPEVDIGLGVPRETIRLERGERKEIRLVAPKSGLDHTTTMSRYSDRKARELQGLDLSGYVLKSGSPTCGLFRVRVYDHNNVPSKTGRGLYAEALTSRLPNLPVEEDGRLRDPRLRENFFERVFAYRRIRNLFRGRWTLGDLVRFHTNEKFLLLAHDRDAYAELGRLVANARGKPRRELAETYESVFMGGLSKIATTRKAANVLQHMAGHLRKVIGQRERAEIATVVDDFRRGLIPLVVPVTLIRHHAHLNDVEYLVGQTFLEPHPKELMLRNHV